MKTIIFYFTLFIGLNLYSQEVKPFTIQNVGWSDTKDTVIEKVPGLTKEDKYAFKETALGEFNAIVVFVFSPTDSLNVVVYSVKNEHSNDNKYIEDFTSVKSKLIEKYGKPKDENIKWRDKLFINDRDQYGFAISIGDLELHSIWELEDTLIMHSLTGDNYKIEHKVYYYNKKDMDSKKLNDF